MAFTTIESSELVDKGVSGLSDTPDIEASDLKERFDSLGKLAIQKFQTHINELEANTASGSIGANVPAGLNASANVQSLIDAMYLLIKELKEYQHTHSNRDTLELITADVKESYDRLATIFNTISEVENVVTGDASKIPTSAAVVRLTKDIMVNGVPGEKGDKGDTGNPGVDGKSAYELAVDNGYTGTLAEWLNSLKGSDGKDGAKGDKGDTGERGAQGIQGIQGVKGDKGDSGVEQQITVSNAVTAYTIKPNILYVFPKLSQLDISFDLTDYNPNIVNDFHFQFTNGSTPCELSFAENVNVNVGDYEPQANGVCEISIVNGLMSYQNWSVVE